MFNFHSNRECNNLLTLRDSVLFFCTIPQLNDNSLNQTKCKCNKNATKCKSKMPCYFLIALVFVCFFFIIEIDINLLSTLCWGIFCIILSDGQWQESRLWSYNIKKAYNVNVVLNVVERKYWIDANKNLCTIFYIVMQNNFYDILYKRKKYVSTYVILILKHVR